MGHGQTDDRWQALWKTVRQTDDRLRIFWALLLATVILEAGCSQIEQWSMAEVVLESSDCNPSNPFDVDLFATFSSPGASPVRTRLLRRRFCVKFDSC